jgi:uncharacterized Zn-finger protein
MTTTYRTMIVHVPATPLGSVPERWVVDHWCNLCRRRVEHDQLIAHAQDHSGGVTPVRDDSATTTCPLCGTVYRPEGRQQFCSTRCRQQAWRRRRSAPTEPVVARSDTVYECPTCEARYLGEQRCDDCNTWCRRVGPGGLCKQCDEPVALQDLLAADQLAPNLPRACRPH